MAVENRVKIAFKLTKDDEGYPSADRENLWAIPLELGRYEIDNIPFYVKGVALGDIVAAYKDDTGQLVFDKVLRQNGHSTIRVVVFEIADKEKVRQDLEELGCKSEGSDVPQMFAVDIPSNVDFEEVMKFLTRGAIEEIFDYEEAAIRY